jgi:Rps23 Pro-64 3,4-dihydroxylase Tpa1-like proline 4-hydroxylase
MNFKAFRTAFDNAKPFKHLILRHLLPEETLQECLEVFPTPSQMSMTFAGTQEDKKATIWEDIPRPIFDALNYCNSAPIISFLQQVTGINGLVPDPFFLGGGCHQILPGGKLGIHTDFTRHASTGLHRRLNMLIYLNHDWEDVYGGHLELWDVDSMQCVKSIRPVFGTTVIFETTDKSFHGHPHPLTCPPHRTRKSLALYYYTNGGGVEAVQNTRFLNADN